MNSIRIVSLLPSATEIVCALGMGDRLVGRSHECDYPPGLESLPVLTRPKLNPHGSSRAIHQEVEAVLTSALSVYEVDAERLRALQPTHIVTQVQCDVCAVSMKDVERALALGFEEQPVVIPLNPTDLAAVYQDIQRVADGLQVMEKGVEVVGHLQSQMQRIHASTANLLHPPRVVCIEWMSPLMSAGNWIPELVEPAGGICLFGEKGQHSRWITWEEVLEADPDYLLVFPCGFSLQKVKEEIHILQEQAAWSQIKAVRERKVYLCDGNQYFNRPGPRLLDSLEIMAEILHPDRFPTRYNHHGYVRL